MEDNNSNIEIQSSEKLNKLNQIKSKTNHQA